MFNSILINLFPGVSLGDLQCSVLSTVETGRDAVLNISTSAQISFVVEDYKPDSGPPKSTPLEYFPYFKNQFIVVAASLNGGNCLATFVKMLQQWTMELGFSVPQCKFIFHFCSFFVFMLLHVGITDL